MNRPKQTGHPPSPGTAPENSAALRLMPITAVLVSFLALVSAGTLLLFGYRYFSAALDNQGTLPDFNLMLLGGCICLVSYPVALIFSISSRAIFARSRTGNHKPLARVSVALVLITTLLLAACLLSFILFCGLAIADFRWTPN